ncbi:uncharacterized protein LOC126886830 [Diabrotica virgifera virgifera]|uniref:Uncharacterized protein n=1 Tax=Diabrotica virgifera virgifera TaxID=50390 RepID=A0ABM5KI38_DIAVI|nr:uncharacterized protein LOC126886830 [Diabrotica virgifera virgifera]
MTPVLFLSCLISFVCVHSEVIKPQFKNYTIIDNTKSHSIGVWYLYSSKESYFIQNGRESSKYLNCSDGFTKYLCSCLQTLSNNSLRPGLLSNPGTIQIPIKDIQEVLVDIEKWLVILPSGTVCDYHEGKCLDLNISKSLGVCWNKERIKKKPDIESYIVEEYTINLNTFIVFKYNGNIITLQLLYLIKNNTRLWCTNRVDMVAFKGSLEDYYHDHGTTNTSSRELGCYPNIFYSNDKNTESKSDDNNIEANTMYGIMNSQKFQQFSESFWVIKFVCVPVITTLILLHMILSCLQFKVLNDLKNGRCVQQEKNSEKDNTELNKNQSNTKETYYESVDYDAMIDQ